MTRPILLALTIFLALPGPAGAQPYPAKLIRMVSGSTPAGAADVTARQIAPRLAEALKVQVIVDNRPGVAGMIANEFVAKAAPDGYTILMQPGSFMTVTAVLNGRGFDPVASLAPVIQLSTYGFLLAVHPSVPARSVKEFIAAARAKPAAITFVSTGVGSNFHLAGELFQLRTKTKLWHVPYKGSPQAIVDLVSGRGDAAFMQVLSLLPHIKEGKLRPLGVTSPARNPLLPDVPPIADTVPGYELSGTEYVMAPMGTPPEVLARLNSALAGIVESGEVKALWAVKGNQFTPNSAGEAAARFKQEYARVAATIKEAGIKPEF